MESIFFKMENSLDKLYSRVKIELPDLKKSKWLPHLDDFIIKNINYKIFIGEHLWNNANFCSSSRFLHRLYISQEQKNELNNDNKAKNLIIPLFPSEYINKNFEYLKNVPKEFNYTIHFEIIFENPNNLIIQSNSEDTNEILKNIKIQLIEKI